MELESSIKFLFSNDFSLFAQVEGGKNIRVNEVNSNKEYNCLFDSESSSTNIAELGKILSSGKNVIAIADDQGVIRLYDFKSRSQQAELREHVTRVLSLKFQEETGFLFSVSADKKIIKWDLSSFMPIEAFDIDKKGTVSEVKCDFIKDDLSLLVSLDNKIVLYNMQLKKAEKKFKGHPTNVNLLRSAPGSKYFASCSSEDAVYIWSIENEIPLLSLPILSQVFINLDIQKVSKGHFLVLVSSTSTLRLWLLRATKTEMQVRASINIPFQDRDLLQARIYDKKSIILSVFEENKPKFYIIPVFSNADSTELKDQDAIMQAINESINQGAQPSTASGKKSKKGKNSELHVVGEIDENVLNQYKGIKGFEKKVSTPGKNGNGDGFLLLDSLKPQEDIIQPETMDSLATVLVQALQNNDVQLLDYCFDNEDEELIENTIKKLAQSRVLILLDKITERIDSGKRANYYLFAWLNYLVKYHSAFLIKSPETPSKIGPVISLLQKRTLPVDQIHRLKGKIDMVLDVENEVRRQKKNQRKLNIEHRPMVVYEEGEVQKPQKEAKGGKGKNSGYTRAMSLLEEMEEEKGDKEFSDSVSDSEEDIDEEFDAYLQEGGQEEYDEGEDDDKGSDDSFIELE